MIVALPGLFSYLFFLLFGDLYSSHGIPTLKGKFLQSSRESSFKELCVLFSSEISKITSAL